MDELEGFWHAARDGLFWKLLFVGGGRGWVEYGREGAYASNTEFTWSAPEPNRLELTYGDCRETEDGDMRIIWPADEHTAHAFTVTRQDDALTTLTLVPPLKSITVFTRKALQPLHARRNQT
ncbi:hypothetical protein OG883_05575 [Streptomyces sp. NBC_01142]|uniref:hypothetical protein n=1 Tax=Streptomyces sp. NBC_01142 TaxID=2975865 RepID=UPI002256E65E|nr:hypothetical protein [Streptomyces sp. NBC_01142]MCX4819383.1 hypothetical protein [Streptomyces sp. NBC_01142]